MEEIIFKTTVFIFGKEVLAFPLGLGLLLTQIGIFFLYKIITFKNRVDTGEVTYKTDNHENEIAKDIKTEIFYGLGTSVFLGFGILCLLATFSN